MGIANEGPSPFNKSLEVLANETLIEIILSKKVDDLGDHQDTPFPLDLSIHNNRL